MNEIKTSSWVVYFEYFAYSESFKFLKLLFLNVKIIIYVLWFLSFFHPLQTYLVKRNLPSPTIKAQKAPKIWLIVV